jgi:hypothetical protein
LVKHIKKALAKKIIHALKTTHVIGDGDHHHNHSGKGKQARPAGKKGGRKSGGRKSGRKPSGGRKSGGRKPNGGGQGKRGGGLVKPLIASEEQVKAANAIGAAGGSAPTAFIEPYMF